MIKVYKNFLTKKEMNQIHSKMTSHYFPWYLNEVLEGEEFNNDYNSQFTHAFYLDDTINSDQFNLVQPIIKKLKAFTILRIKANLLFKTHTIYEHGMHVDLENLGTKITTGIFYVTNNNGYTKFENGTIVNSEQNKFVEFDSSLKHTGSTCTNSRYRIVINFNYIKI
tara:strand:+ start:1211 stop:1711 length:501 start_codon:yes stop_codon:yes gene_type:complete